jgi:hypothetical protein
VGTTVHGIFGFETFYASIIVLRQCVEVSGLFLEEPARGHIIFERLTILFAFKGGFHIDLMKAL